MLRLTTKKGLFAILFTGMTFSTASAQLDKSFLFLNYKRSLKSNFINSEFQIGNGDDRHYLTVFVGYNFSKYDSEKYTPYLTYSTQTEIFYEYKSYHSKKGGFQTGIGYTYYFLDTENKEDIIPYAGIEAYWLHNRDRFSLSYNHIINGSTRNISHVESFNTIATDIHAGIIYGLEKLYFRAAATLGFYLPINTNIYMPTDTYNKYSSRKLPLVGIEPSIQLSMGIKLF